MFSIYNRVIKFHNIEGDDRTDQRRFFMNVLYGGCHVDKGYLAILEVNDSCSYPSLPTNVGPPFVAYTHDNAGGAGVWNNKLYLADEMRMWLTFV